MQAQAGRLVVAKTRSRSGLVVVLLLACTRADPAPAPEPASRSSDPVAAPRSAPVPEPKPAPEPNPAPAEAELLGPKLYPVYRGCEGSSMRVEVVADEVFVTYASDGYGRVDRLGRGPSVSRSAALDFDPGVESRAAYAHLLGLPGPEIPKIVESPSKAGSEHGNPWPWEPLVDISDLYGTSPDDLFVSAEFIVGGIESGHRFSRYRAGRWSAPVKALTYVLEWPAGQVLSFDYYPEWGPFFERLDGKRPSPDVGYLLPTVGKLLGAQLEYYDAQHFECLDFGHSLTGPLAVVLIYNESARLDNDTGSLLGTWIMVWTSPEKPPRFERVTKDVASDASVLVAGTRTFVQVDEVLYEWRRGAAVVLPSLADGARGGCEPGEGGARLLGVDPQGQLWAAHGNCIGVFDGRVWKVETLPGAKQVAQVDGVELGTPWAVDLDNGVWSKTDGAWIQSPFVEPRKASEDQAWSSPRVWVTAPGEAWIRKTYRLERRSNDLPYTMSLSTDLYTTRAVDEILTCRTSPTAAPVHR